MARLALLIIALAACAAASHASAAVATDASTFEFGRFAKHPVHARTRRSAKVCAWVKATTECGLLTGGKTGEEGHTQRDAAMSDTELRELYGEGGKCGSDMNEHMCGLGALTRPAVSCTFKFGEPFCKSADDCEWGASAGTTSESCTLNDAGWAKMLAVVPDAGCRRVAAVGRCSTIKSAADCTASAECKLTSPALRNDDDGTPRNDDDGTPPPPKCMSDTTKVISDLTAKCATENICQAYGKVLAHGERCAAKTSPESCDGRKAPTPAPSPAPSPAPGPPTCTSTGAGGSSKTPAPGATSGNFCFYTDVACATGDQSTCKSTVAMYKAACESSKMSCTFSACKDGCFQGEGEDADDDDDDDDDDRRRDDDDMYAPDGTGECEWDSKLEFCKMRGTEINKDHMLSATMASMSTLGSFKEPCDMAFGHDKYNKATGETSGRGPEARLAAEAKCTAAGRQCKVESTTDTEYQYHDDGWSLECDVDFLAYLGEQGCGGQQKRWARIETLEAQGKVTAAKKVNDKASKRLTKAKAALAKCTSQCSQEERKVASAQSSANAAAAAVATAEVTVVKAKQTEAESGAGRATSMTAAALAGVAAALLCF